MLEQREIAAKEKQKQSKRLNCLKCKQSTNKLSEMKWKRKRNNEHSAHSKTEE